ncbi:hypothetical protein CTAYLR_001449 [Chrysophaeum taylorii]|uniref:Uncharacterized protein n=1 Tax=Chrysophaeum taylorii TaxID=2483200 RepID=A0AAD7U8X4_9STRA|nr:hypothetical protein CTAYLR_001449 [Chrysophaeum taylorii]
MYGADAASSERTVERYLTSSYVDAKSRGRDTNFNFPPDVLVTLVKLVEDMRSMLIPVCKWTVVDYARRLVARSSRARMFTETDDRGHQSRDDQGNNNVWSSDKWNNCWPERSGSSGSEQTGEIDFSALELPTWKRAREETKTVEPGVRLNSEGMEYIAFETEIAHIKNATATDLKKAYALPAFNIAYANADEAKVALMRAMENQYGKQIPLPGSPRSSSRRLSGAEFSCCYAPSIADRCSTCTLFAPSDDFCAASRSNCETACSHVWCSLPTASPTTTEPSPRPSPEPSTAAPSTLKPTSSEPTTARPSLSPSTSAPSTPKPSNMPTPKPSPHPPSPIPTPSPTASYRICCFYSESGRPCYDCTEQSYVTSNDENPFCALSETNCETCVRVSADAKSDVFSADAETDLVSADENADDAVVQAHRRADARADPQAYLHDEPDSLLRRPRVVQIGRESASDLDDALTSGDPDKDCAWVQNFVPTRCAVKGATTFAYQGCPVACGTCANSECGSESTSWYLGSEPSKNCAWVADAAGNRCHKKSVDDTYAFEACPFACDACSISGCEDSADWAKSGEPSKDCSWVAEAKSNRCILLGADGAYAYEACRAACHSCYEALTGADCANDNSWYKKSEPAKTCDWVASFVPKRCVTKGEDDEWAFEMCPEACDTC